MTAPETPDELRARIGAAREYAAKGYGTRGEFGWVVFSAWPDIDALLARLTAAEADADRLRSGLRYTLAWFDASTLAEFRRDASGQSLYDEVAVLRERPQ